MQLSFGKFKGYELEDVPTNYLAFLLEQSFISKELKIECLNEIYYRYSEIDLSNNTIKRISIDQAYQSVLIKYNLQSGYNRKELAIIDEFRQQLIKML
jgi:hypothetical protein